MRERARWLQWLGRKAMEKIYQDMDYAVPCMANFDTNNDDIGGENSYFGNDSFYISKW